MSNYYDQLLISKGGGVFSNTQKARQAEAATIAIGLGGTGISCLRTLKQKVYDTIQQDDPRSARPSYKHIRFLAVDSDRYSIEGINEQAKIYEKIDEDTEFFDLSSGIEYPIVNHLKKLALQPELQWLEQEILKTVSKGLKFFQRLPVQAE